MKIKLKLIRSANGCTQIQKDNLRSLNLKKIGDVAEFNDNPSFRGRFLKVRHLISMER